MNNRNVRVATEIRESANNSLLNERTLQDNKDTNSDTFNVNEHIIDGDSYAQSAVANNMRIPDSFKTSRQNHAFVKSE